MNHMIEMQAEIRIQELREQADRARFAAEVARAGGSVGVSSRIAAHLRRLADRLDGGSAFGGRFAAGDGLPCA